MGDGSFFFWLGLKKAVGIGWYWYIFFVSLHSVN